jgi:DNA replication protein DnaC
MSTQVTAIDMHLRSLHLSSISREYANLADVAASEHWSYEQYLCRVLEVETADRQVRRTERLLKAARLPEGKNLATLEREKLPAPRACAAFASA